MPRKGVKLEIANFRIILLLLLLFLLLLLLVVQLAYLTNRSTDKHENLVDEMKLCDPTNNVMFKSMSFLEKQQQTTSSNTL